MITARCHTKNPRRLVALFICLRTLMVWDGGRWTPIQGETFPAPTCSALLGWGENK
jgi:hypothetical protein